MLANADKEHGYTGGVDEGDQSADHVADGIALGDDEAVERAGGAKGGVEVAGLGHRIGSHEGLEKKNDARRNERVS